MEQRWTSKFELKPGSWVFVPTGDQVLYGSEVKKAIESRWTPPNFYFHLRDGGHVKALKSHLHHNYFLHLDISNFFGSFNRSRVTRCLKGLFSYDQSRGMALQSTVKNPSSSPNDFILPFGFVQSPIIASLCLAKSRLGKYLGAINANPIFSVSVYMDDIIISSDVLEELQSVLTEIKPISEKSRFSFNQNKQEGPSSRITAFNIELSNELLQLTIERLKEFQKVYRETDNVHVLNGIVGYVESVNKEQSLELR